MKKIIPFLVITTIWLAGCGDDDKSGNYIGTWVADNVLVENCSDPSRNGPKDLPCDDASCYRLDLKGDKTYTYQKGLATESGNWSVGDYLVLCTEDDEESVCEKFTTQFSTASMILTADSTSSGCISIYLFNLQMETDDTQQ